MKMTLLYTEGYKLEGEEEGKTINGKKTKLVDIMEELTSEQLKNHTRFSKTSIKQMANTFREEMTQDPRGCPLTVEYTICIALIGGRIS